jgi:hypothetical protein
VDRRRIVESMHEAGVSIAIETHYAQDPNAATAWATYRNLITNAIQATAAGGRVSIATVRDDHVEIAYDTGSGSRRIACCMF